MSGFKKVVALAAIVVLSAGTGVAVAQEITGGQPPAETAAASPAPGPDLLLANGFQNENGFVPTTPCRILDTRKGLGKLPVGSQRTIDVRGSETTFTTQGGNPGGCGIPAGATAIEATITAIDSGSGFLRAWPANLSQPNATFLNYDSAFNVSNTGAITLCGGSNELPCGPNQDLNLQAYGSSTHLVIDVGGYYIRKMAAVINVNGTVRDGNRVVASANLPGNGNYSVTFDRNITQCTYQATIANTSGKGYAMVDPRLDVANGVFIATYDETGTLSDSDFYVEVTC
jgi:hypothetical protein